MYLSNAAGCGVFIFEPELLFKKENKTAKKPLQLNFISFFQQYTRCILFYSTISLQYDPVFILAYNWEN